MIIYIQTAVYYALASNMLFMFPPYLKLIKSKKVKVYLQDGKVFSSDEKYPSNWNGYEAVYDSEKQFLGEKLYTMKETNFFVRKPFTCLYCMSFWIALATSFSWLTFSGFTSALSVAVIVPPIAILFQRILNSFDVKF